MLLSAAGPSDDVTDFMVSLRCQVPVSSSVCSFRKKHGLVRGVEADWGKQG